MFKNYLKITLRHIRKNKGFSLLNVFGLALGLTCALLILLWIEDELSYDRFHKKYDSLYQVMENHNYDGKIYTFAATPGLLAGSMKADFPEVKNTCRMAWGERWLFSLNEKPINEDGNYTDPAFFDMFTFEFIYGEPGKALHDDHSIVITERMAKKFFGPGTNPVGKYLKVNDKTEFVITGVIQDPPSNSSLRFNWLASFRIFEKENPWTRGWSTNGLQTFVELKQGADVTAFNKKFKDYIRSKESDASARPLLLAMNDWRLRSNFEEGKQSGGRIEYVRLFGVIAILLVITACINFMNLATARSEQRAKEVGVRKVMGAQRSALISQFIGESLVLSFFSMVLACLLAMVFLPWFNDLVGKKLSMGFHEPLQWLILLGITLLCGIVAGSYPSIFLSSFSPVVIFKGLRPTRNSGTVYVRKTLVVTQFVISTVLIISTLVIYKQIEHVKNRQLGFNKERLLYLTQKGKINQNLELIRQDLLQTGVVSHAASCNQRVMQLGNNTGGFEWKGKNPATDVLITTEYVSPDYLNTAGMQLAKGRDFNPDAPKDSNNVLINEALAKILGKEDPLNTIIRQDSTEYTVVGVVKNFVFNNMYQSPDPVIIFCMPQATSYYFVRLKEGVEEEAALKKVEAVFKKDNPGYPFEYDFLQEDFNWQFKSEMLISSLSRLFAILTIVVSCLGLFGLAAYTAERRTKEVGIRKVLGATVSNVVLLLSKDFLLLVIIAVGAAFPLAWYIMKLWLQEYSYRISMQGWMFFAAGAAALLIALVTVSFQAIRAANANPVKNLRTE
jgi:putative ABC transport system permease protein